MAINYDNVTEEGTMECDNCGETLDAMGSWQEVIDEAKNEGWIIRRDDIGDWWHYCSTDCYAEGYEA